MVGKEAVDYEGVDYDDTGREDAGEEETERYRHAFMDGVWVIESVILLWEGLVEGFDAVKDIEADEEGAVRFCWS